MCAPARIWLTWFLAAVFAVVAGVGEGLHILPGMGHAVEENGRLFYLGIAPPQCGPYTGIEGSSFDTRQGDGPLVLDEDQCAICSVCAQGKSLAKHVDFALMMPFVHQAPAVTSCDLQLPAVFVFQARAPPIA